MLILTQRNFFSCIGIKAVALTSKTTRKDLNVWLKVENRQYFVILTSFKILLKSSLVFWLQIVQQRRSMFSCRLAYIAIDKAHLIWGWQTFQKDYRNIGNLKAVFPDISIIALSATIMRNVLEHIRKSLKLRPIVHLYKKTLDRPNIIYIVQENHQARVWQVRYAVLPRKKSRKHA